MGGFGGGRLGRGTGLFVRGMMIAWVGVGKEDVW